MALRFSILFGGNAAPLQKETSKVNAALGTIKKTAIGVAQSVGVAYATYFSVAQVIDVTKRYQKLEAQLKTSTGSLRNQAAAFAALKQFAMESGQSVDSTITAFTRLVNLGLDPSKEALLAYGNVAAATGKTTLDFVEAVADAATGEFERLKEFGIKSRNEGETVKFTFRGVATSVKNNAADIEKYLQSIGQNEFGDALANQAVTLEAAINRAGITWDGFVYAISNAGVGEFISDVLESVSGALDELTRMIESGQIGAELDAWLAQFEYLIDGFTNGITFVKEYFATELDAIGEASDSTLDQLIEGFKHLPSNIKAFLQIVTVELLSLVKMGEQYGKAFAQIVGIQLAKLAQKTRIWAKDMADAVQFWDGDTFNADAAYKQVDKIAADMTGGLLEAAQEQVDIFKKARLDTIDLILTERDQALDSYDQQIEKAKELRAEYEANRKARENTDLGQFRVKPAAPDTDAPTAPDAPKQAGEENPPKDKGISESQLEKLRTGLATEREAILAHHNELMLINQQAFDQQKIQQEEFEENKLRIATQYREKLSQLEAAQTSMMLNNYGQLFGGIADLAKTFGGEQSKAYKVMFAASKAFSIAQSIIAIQTGISQAIALGFPQNIPVIAQTVAAGAKVMNTLKGTELQGMAHDGISRVPAANEGTWLLKRGEMVLNNKQRDNFEQLVNRPGKNTGTGGVVIHNKIDIDARGAAEGSEQAIAEAMDKATERMKREIGEDFDNNGPLLRKVKQQAA